MWWRPSSRLCQVSLKPLWWLQWHQTPHLDTWSLCLLYFGSCLATGCQTCWRISFSCLILLKLKCDFYCFATAEGEESVQLLGMKRGVSLCFDWSRVSLPEVNECMYCQRDDCVCLYVLIEVYYVAVNWGGPPVLSFTHKPLTIKKPHAPHSSPQTQRSDSSEVGSRCFCLLCESLCMFASVMNEPEWRFRQERTFQWPPAVF